jgi:hypothetical protein
VYAAESGALLEADNPIEPSVKFNGVGGWKKFGACFHAREASMREVHKPKTFSCNDLCTRKYATSCKLGSGALCTLCTLILSRP